MTRFVNTAAALAAVLAAAPARAQISAAGDRAAGIPAGLALPVLGAATAEEPSALGTNPAGPGFVHAPALQWFHEGATRPGLDADGLYGAGRLGPLGAAGSLEWIRPGQGDGARYRRSRPGLSAGDGRALSLGVAWTWISSRDGNASRAPARVVMLSTFGWAIDRIWYGTTPFAFTTCLVIRSSFWRVAGL